MKKMMDTKLDAFRQEFNEKLRSPRKNQEHHEQTSHHKEAKPRRPQEKPNWKSRSTKDESNCYYFNRDAERCVEQARSQQNEIKEVKTMKQSQKEHLSSEEQLKDDLLKILNAYNKPKKIQSGLPSNSKKAKFSLPSKFVKDTIDLAEIPDFVLENDQACD